MTVQPIQETLDCPGAREEWSMMSGLENASQIFCSTNESRPLEFFSDVTSRMFDHLTGAFECVYPKRAETFALL